MGGVAIFYVTTLPKNRFFRMLWKGILGFEAYKSFTHYYQFTRETAMYLIERAGFKVQRSFISKPSYSILNKFLSIFFGSNFPGIIIIGEKDKELMEINLSGKRKNLGL